MKPSLLLSFPNLFLSKLRSKFLYTRNGADIVGKVFIDLLKFLYSVGFIPGFRVIKFCLKLCILEFFIKLFIPWMEFFYIQTLTNIKYEIIYIWFKEPLLSAPFATFVCSEHLVKVVSQPDFYSFIRCLDLKYMVLNTIIQQFYICIISGIICPLHNGRIWYTDGNSFFSLNINCVRCIDSVCFIYAPFHDRSHQLYGWPCHTFSVGPLGPTDLVMHSSMI